MVLTRYTLFLEKARPLKLFQHQIIQFHRNLNGTAAVQDRQGLYISCIEEIAWRNGWISDEQLRALGDELNKTSYGKYLLELLDK